MVGGWARFRVGLMLCVAGWPVHAQQAPGVLHAALPIPGRGAGLGVNIHFTDARPGEMEMLAAGGFRWVRMDFGWEATERERGRYDFAAYDRLLEALELHGLRALWILDYSNRLYEADRSVATEAGREAFARWAAAAAAHFRGRGVLWEIWNEPNIPNFWKPAPELADYVALAARATAAIRGVAPGEAILGPGTSEIDLAFLEGCFRAGLLDGWDAVSVHPYRQSDPESVVAEYARLRRLIDRYAPPGKAIPILSGEWGYSAAWRGFDADRQGRLLPRQWLINMARGIPISIWYDWHDDGRDLEEAEHHFGTVENRYHEGRDPVYNPKPAYHAARTLAGILEGRQFAKRVAVGGAEDYVLHFVGDGNGDRLAAWTVGASPRPVSVPSADGTYAVVSHTGDPLPSLVAAEGVLSIRLTAAPVYLIPDPPDPVWREAPAAPALDVSAAPGPGRRLTIRIDNLDASAFDGMLRVVEESGPEPTMVERPLRLGAGEVDWELPMPLPATAGTGYRAGIRILDARDREVLRIPARGYTPVPDALWQGARAFRDGDADVASHAVFREAPAPEPFADAGVSVFELAYDFADGWSFLRVVPADGDDPDLGLDRPAGFGIWVYGDGGHTVPRLRVRDASGQTWQPTGKPIDWVGWRFVAMPLDSSGGHWGGSDDGVIHAPLRWDSVFLLDNPSRRTNRGAIYLAAPVVME